MKIKKHFLGKKSFSYKNFRLLTIIAPKSFFGDIIRFCFYIDVKYVFRQNRSMYEAVNTDVKKTTKKQSLVQSCRKTDIQ